MLVGLTTAWLLTACAPAAPAPASKAGAASAPASPAAPTAAVPPAAPTAAPTAAALPTSPPVAVKIGVSPVNAYAPFFVAQARGYFQELGLEVELVPTANTQEQLPALTQGQLHVGSCGATLGCLNALNRRTDLKIVAGMARSGVSEKSSGNNALVVRGDLWDSGAVRAPADLVGRTVYLIAGAGSSAHGYVVHWLRAAGVDPASVEYDRMGYADQLVAMSNRAIELGVQAQPVLGAGVERGLTRVLATQEEMSPTGQTLFMMYWGGIDRLGPRVGERIMVAYLRGVRDYMNAFEYGVDQEAIIDVLVQDTTIKDPALFRRMSWSYTDPNGLNGRASIEEDARLFHELGLLREPVDLSQAFDDRYRAAAVGLVGEYQPPR